MPTKWETTAARPCPGTGSHSAHRQGVLFITHDIGESILLANRVGLMTAGPEARMKTIVPVDLAPVS